MGTDIRTKQDFFNWGKAKGIDLANLRPENINNDIAITLHTFGSRASEIKAKYNHKFNIKVDKFFDDYIVVNSMDFQPI